MKNKFSFYEILLLVWTIVIPTAMSTLIVIVYLEELDKITFIDNTLMKIAFAVSVLHLVIMLGVVINSIINDIEEIKKRSFYRKHPEEREKAKQKELDDFKKLFEILDKKIQEEKERKDENK